MRKGIHEKVGVERFKNLMDTMTVKQMSVLLCTHHSKDELRAGCQACRRAIYRSIKKIREEAQKEKSLDVIDKFDKIPEVDRFMEYLKAKGIKESGRKIHYSKLKRMWGWIRLSKNSFLLQNQRPALWTMDHVKHILARITEMRISNYGWKQTLRRLFESQERLEFLTHTLLRARRRDLKSPRGRRKERVKDYADPEEFIQMLNACDSDYERLKLKVHVTLKSREGSSKEHREMGASFCHLRWERVNWKDTYYGVDLPKVTIAVFESKTGGGTIWEHCPLDLYWRDLPDLLKKHWESQGSPKKGYLWGEDTYKDYLRLFRRIMERTGLDLSPHDMRSTGATWLHSQGADNLAIGQYNPTTGQAIGFGGVGWENAEIYFQRYGRLGRDALRKLWTHVHKEVGVNGFTKE